jgi:hypothetical protein
MDRGEKGEAENSPRLRKAKSQGVGYPESCYCIKGDPRPHPNAHQEISCGHPPAVRRSKIEEAGRELRSGLLRFRL